MRAIHETGVAATEGSAQLPLTHTMSAPDATMYSEIPNDTWHELCFRVRSLRLKQPLHFYRAETDDLPEIDFYADCADPQVRLPGLPSDERLLLNWPGACPGFPLLVSGFPFGTGRIYVGAATDSDFGANYPPGSTMSLADVVPDVSPSITNVERAYLYAGNIWPFVYCALPAAVGAIVSMNVSAPGYTTEALGVNFRIDQLSVTLPLFLIYETGGPGGDAAKLVNDAEFGWGGVDDSYYPYAESGGANPIWDHNTGDQLLNPFDYQTS